MSHFPINGEEKTKRPRDDDGEGSPPMRKSPRTEPKPEQNTRVRETLKHLLWERRKKTAKVTSKIAEKIQVLEDLKKRIYEIDETLHCDLEMVSGHSSAAVLSVFPCKETGAPNG